MKLLLIAFVFVQTVTAPAFGQSDVSGFKSDLRIFREALEETHPNLYRFTPRERFRIVFDSIEQQITNQTTQLEYFRLLSRIESFVREGHTYLQPSEILQRHIQQQRIFPFNVVLNNDKIVVERSFSENYQLYEGKEIYSINGEKSGEIVRQIANATGLKSGYNNAGLLNVLSFENNFSFAYHYFIDTTSAFLIQLEGSPGIVNVQGRRVSPGKVFPEFAREADPPMSLQIDSVKGVAVMKITTFAHWTVSFRESDYRKTFRKYFDKLEKTEIKNLIIDVRDNRGGEELLAAELLTYLMKSEFRIYTSIKAKTLNFDFNVPNATKFRFSEKDYYKTDSGYFKIDDKVLQTFRPKTKNHFRGNVYVLSNGGSRSATNTMLALMRAYHVGTIIGQESGGVCGDVDGRMVVKLTLPYSGIHVCFPAWSFKINSRGGNRMQGVIPDYNVPIHQPGHAAGSEDAALALAYKLIREN